MRQATVIFDESIVEAWDLEAFQDAGLLDAEILSCEGTSGVVRIHVEGEVDEQRLDDADVIQWWERVAGDGAGYVYLFEGDATDSFETMEPDVDGFPRTENVEITEQGPCLTYVGSQEQINAAVAEAKANGIDVDLRRLGNYRTQERPVESVTKRQREVLEVAFDRGYYDVPRSASTEEIAVEFDLDDSTVSEHLQRAERNLLATALGRSG